MMGGTLWEECACQWCANLDATPCSIINELEGRVEALENAVRRLLPNGEPHRWDKTTVNRTSRECPDG